MAIDKSSNFAKTTITGIASGATEVVLDDATNFLDPASGEYNCVIWEISNYGNPADDPNKEIVRATALSGSTLTITRAQEGTIASNHNTGGETYAIANVLTKKMIDDIETEIDAKANLISPSFTTPNIGSATGSSLALEGTTLGMLSLKNTDAASYTRMLFDGTGVDFTTGVGNASAAITDLRNKYYVYDLTNGKTAFTIIPNTLAAKFYGSLEATNLSGTNTGDEVAASSAEINTGTDETKYVTPDALAGSNAFTKPVQQYCVEWGTELAVKDGVGYIEIPPECNGMNLISARARVGTAGTTNASTFDIYNVTDSHSMLSSAISIASGATSGTGTVDTSYDDVATGDVIRFDVETLSTTKPKGLIISLAFRLP